MFRWLFRYVLTFLRDDILPQDPKLLRELYLESEFWRLDSLRKAIEMRNMELLQSNQESEAAALLSVGSSSSLKLKAGLKSAGASASSSLLGRLKGAAEPTKSTAATESKDPNAWWLDPPLWWGGSNDEKNSSDAKKQSEPPAKVSAFASLLKKSQAKTKAEGSSAANEQDAWWKSTTYKGVDFVETLSGSPEKKASQQHKQNGDTRNQEAREGGGKTTPRVPLIVNTTWSSSHHLSG